MKLSDAQKKVDLQIMNYGGYWRPLSMMLRLIEETGELARAINIKYGDKRSKSISDGREIQMELVDVFYTSVALANYYKIDLDITIKINSDSLVDKDDVNVNYLSVLLKLTSKIGKLSETITIESGIDSSKVLIDDIANIILTIIDIASELEIDLLKYFDIKVAADESKMIKVYNK